MAFVKIFTLGFHPQTQRLELPYGSERRILPVLVERRDALILSNYIAGGVYERLEKHSWKSVCQ